MVKNKLLPIRWDKFAKEEFKQAISYYKQYSIQGANNVKGDILQTVSKLNLFPEKYPLEPHLGEPFRYVTVRDFKIIYYITSREIRIVDVFNSKQSPTKMTRIIH